MTRKQALIKKFIHRRFFIEDIDVLLVGKDKVRITDKSKRSITLSMNEYGDIIDAETGECHAVSNLPREQGILSREEPSSWTNYIDRR